MSIDTEYLREMFVTRPREVSRALERAYEYVESQLGQAAGDEDLAKARDLESGISVLVHFLRQECKNDDVATSRLIDTRNKLSSRFSSLFIKKKKELKSDTPLHS